MSRALAVSVLLIAGCGTTPTPVDGGSTTPDTGIVARDVGTDGNIQIDSGPSNCAEGFAGCFVATTLDDTSMDAVTISATGGAMSAARYDHPCVRVHAGTVVTITNSATHPLSAATCSPADSPILAAPTADTFTFANVGQYGFYCHVHGSNTGAGMAGLIVVE